MGLLGFASGLVFFDAREPKATVRLVAVANRRSVAVEIPFFPLDFPNEISLCLPK
jgi:hypothetical protein